MTRQGNSLSKIIREAWDGSDLTNLVKNSPLAATGVHFSLIGHTTREELLRNLTSTEIANGFANRILWCMVRRSKLVPEGDPFPPELLTSYGARIAGIVEWARTIGEVKRDRLAKELWNGVYGPLSEGRPGLSGMILNRSESQVLRLSLVYALLDRSNAITVSHLRAALAVWDCCESSVLFVFGDRTGSPVADRILDELKAKGELTRDEVVNLFSRHKTDEVDRDLAMLLRIGKISMEQRSTGGRPATVYRMATKAR